MQIVFSFLLVFTSRVKSRDRKKERDDALSLPATIATIANIYYSASVFEISDTCGSATPAPGDALSNHNVNTFRVKFYIFSYAARDSLHVYLIYIE